MSRPAAIAVRTVDALRPLKWLRRGWDDLRRGGVVSLLHGAAIAGFGLLIGAVAHDRFWLVAGALSGFMVVAPVLATSLYAISRSLEAGERPTLALVGRTWNAWQSANPDRMGEDYWCLVRFGLLLALAATGWVLTSAALITLLAPAPVREPLDFLHHVVLAERGWLFELWLALGGVLAAPIFASSVVSMPLLLDRRVNLVRAVLTSWQVVLANPVPCAVWAALIMLVTLAGMAPMMLGLVVAVPLLGHASWHAYRDLVDASAVPAREAPAGVAARR
jgi:uncharacterized membrane protein